MSAINRKPQKSNSSQWSIFLFCLLSAATSCSGQQKDTSYWTLTEIKKVSGKPMHGATLAYMEEIASSHPYFKRSGNRLSFEFPSQKELAVTDFTNFSDRKELSYGNPMDTVTGVNLVKGQTVVTFIYKGTLDQDKLFEAIYENTHSTEYLKRLEQDKENLQLQNTAIEKFVSNYENPGLKTYAKTKKPNKRISLKGKYGEVRLRIPSEYQLKSSGDVTAYKFGAFQLGSFADNDIYNLINEESGESVATIFVTQARGRTFKLEDYLSTTKYKVRIKDDRTVYAIEPVYNSDKKTVEIQQHITFGHFKKDQTQIFLLAENDDEKQAAHNRQVIKSILIE